jgi:ketosteroid isomerase-like protein
MKKFLPLLFILFACSHGSEVNEIEKHKLLKTDEDFSKMSFQQNMKEAFEFYAADEAILMREGNDPLNGKTEMLESFANMPNDSIRLTWTPVKADVSGELGYTFGTWERKVADTGSIERGTYVTVWKKQDDGTWRFVLDAGNSGKKTQ